MSGQDARCCAGCGAALSRYNRAPRCSRCERTGPAVSADFWDLEQVWLALAQWDLGTLVRLYRRAAGVTQSAIAALVSIDQSEVSRLERGQRRVGDRRQVIAWCQRLGVPERLLAEVPPAPQVRPLFLSAVAGIGDDVQAGGRPTPEQVHRLVFELQRRDNQIGADTLLDEASQSLRQVVGLLSGGTSDVVGLHQAAGQLAQMVGWLSLDAGRPEAARQNLTTALYAAHMGGATDLAGSVLGYLSLTALYHGSPAEGLALARTARDTASGVTGLTGAMLSVRLARALAENGQAAECRTALHQAERMFSGTVAAETGPVWLSYFNEPELLAQQGTALMNLGALAEAKTCLTGAVRHLEASPDGNLRDQVHYRIRLADIALRAGDLDESCHQSSKALALNERISSTRMVRNLRDFLAKLRPHRAAEPVRSLFETVTDSRLTDPSR